ncbi:Octanoyltransferase [Trichinella spiralis]|uniref:Octanoyltransferase n=1 Tax=Trichinella spiralis TaxID=6334 RepID=A0ABR3KD87_TRISP
MVGQENDRVFDWSAAGVSSQSGESAPAHGWVTTTRSVSFRPENPPPPDWKLVLPSLRRAGSSTTSLATGLVISAVEVRSRAWEEFRHHSEGASHARDVVLQYQDGVIRFRSPSQNGQTCWKDVTNAAADYVTLPRSLLLTLLDSFRVPPSLFPRPDSSSPEIQTIS